MALSTNSVLSIDDSDELTRILKNLATAGLNRANIISKLNAALDEIGFTADDSIVTNTNSKEQEQHELYSDAMSDLYEMAGPKELDAKIINKIHIMIDRYPEPVLNNGLEKYVYDLVKAGMPRQNIIAELTDMLADVTGDRD